MAPNESQVESIFFAALEKELPEERKAYLDEACADDKGLRRRVDALLRAQPKLGHFLQGDVAHHSAPELPGAQIGSYKLLEQLGEGGFGVVYAAEQIEPVKRRVALKIIKPGMDTKEVIARFEAERQALALMDHPHIARVLDGGTTESGRPFFVMELVKGVPITDYCDQCNLTTRERLELFVQVCRAVQHAHQKGVIHRDLKPSNVMIAMEDGRPVPKIIDFGVAKAINQRLTEKTLVTAFAQVLGTPLYMSPEQAELSPLDVDTRSDIYSLGVLLYELLTSTTPLEKERAKEASYDELRRMIRDEEPPKPSARISTLGDTAVTVAERHRTDVRRLRHAVRGDLDWIVMKALEKDRVRRYDTASALAEDVMRHLDDEPIEARPPSTMYKFRKFTDRNRAALITAILVLIAAVVGLIVSTVLIAQERNVARAEATRATIAAQRESEAANQALTAASQASAAADEAQHEREQAIQARNLAWENLYFAHTHLSYQDWHIGNVARMRTIVNEHIPEPNEPDLRGWEWYYLFSLCHTGQPTLYGHHGAINSLSLSPDGKRIASGSADQTVRVWDVEKEVEIAALNGHESEVFAVSWSPDGKWLASGEGNGRLIIWDAVSLSIQEVMELKDQIRSIPWAPMGDRFLAAGQIWEIQSTSDSSAGRAQVSAGPMLNNVHIYDNATWSPDGRKIGLVRDFPGRLEIYAADHGDLIVRTGNHNDNVRAVAWSHDGKSIATAGTDQTVQFVETDNWETVTTIDRVHRGQVYALAWSPDDELLTSSGEDALVKVWDVSTGQQVKCLRGHEKSVRTVAWKNDIIVSGGEDGTIREWDLTLEPEFRAIPGRWCLVWSPDGRFVATFGPRRDEPFRTVDIYDSKTLSKRCELRYEGTGGTHSIAFSPDGNKLAAAILVDNIARTNGHFIVWDVSTRQQIVNISAHEGEARSVSWSPDGLTLATAGTDGLVDLWTFDPARKVFSFREHIEPLGSAVWSPDGTRIASASWRGEVKIWEPSTGRVIHNLWRPQWGAEGHYSISWSPDGDRLAAACSSGEIIVWDTESGRETIRFRGHTAHIRAVAWSPDGRRIASVGYDRYVKIWDSYSARELLSLSGHTGPVHSVTWSPDGKRLATASGAEAKIWDASIGYELAREVERP